MNDHAEVLAAIASAGILFVAIVVPVIVLLIGLGALGLGLAARLAEPRHARGREVHNRR
ncbi:MAG: hypothetical protein ACHQ15_04835 [Candidatus Limnocylindrales bacterium]